MNKCFNIGAEQKQSLHLKQVPFKYAKWKFLAQIDHSVIFTEFLPKTFFIHKMSNFFL